VDIAQQMLGTVPVIRVDGDLDHLSAPALEKAFRAQVSAGDHRMVLDLSGCPHIDSGGLAVILSTVAELRDDGLLAIVAPSRSIRRLLEVVGLYELRRCAVFNTEPEALSALALTPRGMMS
jgi:anti-anti-sigma factor